MTWKVRENDFIEFVCTLCGYVMNDARGETVLISFIFSIFISWRGNSTRKTYQKRMRSVCAGLLFFGK